MTPDSEETDTPDESKPSLYAQAAIVAGLGFEIVGFTVAGVWLGNRLDDRFGTEPLATVLGLVLALTAVGFHIWRVVQRFVGTSRESTHDTTD
jgi:F0F1-type ATP synthase assembly protein I